ncbi:MAG: helix-turn-helix domain-containing protein [Phycisphaerales bacterium]|nr:helix-turn-helix domain-containing protein [Phycisphaerales bacterium]
MAKLFYTLEEAAKRLGKSEAELKQLVATGQLQEFRDRDRLMFKVDQVNLLASGGDDEGGSGIPLAESGDLGAISLASDSGSSMNLESPKEQTGISIFDADATEEADPSAVTQVTETSASELALETVGSGSGLLDLTRESDDTSLGKDVLAGVGDGSTAAETQVESESGALFESTGAESEVAVAPGGVMVLAEPYDGAGSGLAGGLALAMIAVLAFTMVLVIFGLAGMTDAPLIATISGNLNMWMGIAAGVVVIFGIVGLLIGKKT